MTLINMGISWNRENMKKLIIILGSLGALGASTAAITIALVNDGGSDSKGGITITTFQKTLNDEQTRINGLSSTGAITASNKAVTQAADFDSTIAIAHGITLGDAAHGTFTYTYTTTTTGITITAILAGSTSLVASPVPLERAVNFILTDQEKVDAIRRLNNGQ